MRVCDRTAYRVVVSFVVVTKCEAVVEIVEDVELPALRGKHQNRNWMTTSFESCIQERLRISSFELTRSLSGDQVCVKPRSPSHQHESKLFKWLSIQGLGEQVG